MITASAAGVTRSRVRRPPTNARQRPTPIRRTPDVPRLALHAQRESLALWADEGRIAVRVAVADVPGGSLEIGEKGVAEGKSQRAAERSALGHERECVGPTERLVVVEAHPQAGAIREPPLGVRRQVHALAAHVAIAEEERRGTPSVEAQTEHGGDLVDGLNLDAHAAGGIRYDAHFRIGEEWLEAQNALRLRPLAFRTRPPHLQQQEDADYSRPRGRVMQANATGERAELPGTL
jgi:hypothetical protein